VKPKLEKFDDVVAIGGGKVIDYAKMLTYRPIIAIPTTGCGSSRTTHAVVWDYENNIKEKFQCPKPIEIIRPEYWDSLIDKTAYYETMVDILCHLIESFISKNANDDLKKKIIVGLELLRERDLIWSSLIAGDCIEEVGTNMIHALSYSLTLNEKLSHGVALYTILRRIHPYIKNSIPMIDDILSRIKLKDYSIDSKVERLVKDAMKYNSLYTSIYPVDYDTLWNVLCLGGL
jgi:alcohol dehydrogenase class IV